MTGELRWRLARHATGSRGSCAGGRLEARTCNMVFRDDLINGGAEKLAVGARSGWGLTVVRGTGWEALCELRVNSDGMHGGCAFPSAAPGLNTGAHATEGDQRGGGGASRSPPRPGWQHAPENYVPKLPPIISILAQVALNKLQFLGICSHRVGFS